MLNVRLAGNHLFGKLLFTWLSLVVSMVMSFCAVLFPTRCLGWDLELNWVSFWEFSFLLLNMKLTYFCVFSVITTLELQFQLTNFTLTAALEDTTSEDFQQVETEFCTWENGVCGHLSLWLSVFFFCFFFCFAWSFWFYYFILIFIYFTIYHFLFVFFCSVMTLTYD